MPTSQSTNSFVVQQTVISGFKISGCKQQANETTVKHRIKGGDFEEHMNEQYM